MSLIVTASGLDLDTLGRLQRPPVPFEPGDGRFWEDPYISAQMLAAHLNPESDAASRRPHIIDQEVSWLVDKLQLNETTAVLDLGCGPGLYASRLARRSIPVTGMDYSRRSIEIAQRQATAAQSHATFLLQDYLEMDFEADFDAVLMMNGDFGELSPERRTHLLDRIQSALKPRGWFLLDVGTRRHWDRYRVRNQWYVADQGFWRPEQHLVLEQGFEYPSIDVLVNQYAVIEGDGTVTVYRNWFQAYTAASIRAEIETAGLSVAHLGSDLRGGALTDSTEWIGVVAQKPPRLC